MLPCKPDYAEREVQLGALRAPLYMSGCEADGKLFAFSRLALTNTAQADSYVSIWNDQVLARMKSTGGDAWNAAPSVQGLRVVRATRVSGSDSSGKTIEARLMWLASKDSIFHIAVYGQRLEDSQLEMLTSQMRLSLVPAP